MKKICSSLQSLILLIALATSTVSADTTETENNEWNDAVWEDAWGDDASAESDLWKEAEATPENRFSGFIEVAYGERLNDDDVIQQDDTLNELRLRVEWEKQYKAIEIQAKADIYHDEVEDDSSARWREASVFFRPHDNIDVKIGRQILTWGTGDLVFLNDLFPKNWKAFFAGNEMSYLKAPSDAIKAGFFLPAFNIDLVLTPEFDADVFIDGNRFSYFSPMTGKLNATPDIIMAEKPGRSLHNSEVAIRLYKTVNGKEYAAYAYRGFFKQPLAFSSSTGQAWFPKMYALGGSVRGTWAKGIANMEFAWHQSREDAGGKNPLVPNSRGLLLLGYERELVKQLTGAWQYYVEYTHAHDDAQKGLPNPDWLTDEFRQVLTMRLNYRTMRDRLTYSFFLFHSPNDHDGLLLLDLDYRYSDRLMLSAGSRWFFGREIYSFFGQFEDASNLFLRGRYSF